MDDPEAAQERAELLSGMFALITVKLEDAATIAVDCQGRVPPEDLLEHGQKLRELITETSTVLDAALALIAAAQIRT